MGTMKRPVLLNWKLTAAESGLKDSDELSRTSIISRVQKQGKVNCRELGLTLNGELRNDSEYDLDDRHPLKVMALKSSPAGVVALTETYSEFILA